MKLRRFYVKPQIPTALGPLYKLAYNLWSTWDARAVRLFERMDPGLFRQCNHNRVEFLHRLGSERLAELAEDPGFRYELEQVWNDFVSYLGFEGGYRDREGAYHQFDERELIAYLSMEFGLHESIPIYSGGLGLLAGDYLKAASDVGLPLVGWGLLYTYGYFTQRITAQGEQEEEYRENVWWLNPVEEVKDHEGEEVRISVPLAGRQVTLRLWRVNVGRTALYLLDSDVPENPPELRAITDNLYDSQRGDRIEQELMLGRGSLLAMRRLGMDPKVFHLNEGHSAFLIIERLRELMLQKGHDFETASNIIRHTTVFTTHTPVIEGNEHFDLELVKKYLSDDLKELGIDTEKFWDLGRIKSGDGTFWLPALAMRFSRMVNGVSAIHAEVSRQMWRPLFPRHHPSNIPIISIRNGVHLSTWLSPGLRYLFDRYIGPDYLHQAESPEVWHKVHDIPDDEVWESHYRSKRNLINYVRSRLSEQMQARGSTASRVREVENVLNPRALTIGLARRFAPYKRLDLILQDPQRLVEILSHPERPVQVIFAGKAHPADLEGKQILKRIWDFIVEHDLGRRMVILENYDIASARHLVRGVDVWLNTPLKPHEASGTSGMKAGINGVLNFSIMDGWWPECYNGENGWAITAGETHRDPEIRRAVEANQIYDLLEHEIAPRFYDRPDGEMPRDWVLWMKNSIATVGMGFNMHRMLHSYLHTFYLPEMATASRLLSPEGEALAGLAKMRELIDKNWPQVKVRDFFSSADQQIPEAGSEITVEAYVHLGQADQALFQVEVCFSHGKDQSRLSNHPLQFQEKYSDGVAKYQGAISLTEPGMHGLGVRISPADETFRQTYPGYLKWGD